MNTNDTLAKHGLVVVLANDVRRMMDAYQASPSGSRDNASEEAYNRLWSTMNEVGLAYGSTGS